MIVYSVELGLVVEDTAQAIDQIKDLVVSAGGYIASSRTWYEGPLEKEQLHGYLTVRVPAPSLDQALTDFKALATKVEQENLDGQDVTEEYSDLTAQLSNLEATETELRELLTEVRENRGKASEILEVHNRLTEIRGEIERLKGRMQYLERSAAMARVDINVAPEEAPVEIIEDEWQITRTVRTAARALVQGLQFVADVLIFLLFLSPVWGIPVLIFLGLRALVRRRRRRKAAEEATQEETSTEEVH
jgi:chromosome segregation ATPase